MSKALEEILVSLRDNTQDWVQERYTLDNTKIKVELWTSNIPYFDVGIYLPRRKLNMRERIKLQRSINAWHKNAELY